MPDGSQLSARRNRFRASWWYAATSITTFSLGLFPTLIGVAAEHVIHISVDGLRPSYLQAVIDGGGAPNLQRFQLEGAWTNNARTDFTYTNTLPNHTSMLTGRPVSQPAGMPTTTQHGYTLNIDPAITDTLHNSGNPNLDYISSVFDVVHDAGLSTGLYASKSKFVLYDKSYNAETGAPHANSRDKIDFFFAEQNSNLPYSLNMQERFLSDMAAEHFEFSFVHYADTDVAGHASGCSLAYIQAIQAVDDYLRDVFSLVETDPELVGNTVILLTTDHGGSGTGHSTATLPENYTIPVFVWGSGVGQGDLYDFNRATRTDPLTSRPSYSDVGQPIRNGDTGNLALTLLGLGPVSGSLIDANQDLRVSLAGDYNLDGTVDAADYTVWRNSLGATTELAADGNNNKMVDTGDYVIWKQQFGKSTGGGFASLSQVPEPTAGAAILVFACIRLAASARRCRYGTSRGAHVN
jgi:Type I phosphodiesterase / nucleotide pyrophosphatase